MYIPIGFVSYTPGDKVIKIMNENGVCTHIIKHYTCTLTVKNSTLYVFQSSESKQFSLNFYTNEEAILGHKILRDAIKSLEQTIIPNSNLLFFDTLSDFPNPGVIDTIYVDKQYNKQYIYDFVTNSYIEFSPDQVIPDSNLVFVDTLTDLPNPGVIDTIYVDKQYNKQYIYDFTTNAYVELFPAPIIPDSNLLFFDTVSDFPNPGVIDTIYIDKQFNKQYVYDVVSNTYIKMMPHDYVFTTDIPVNLSGVKTLGQYKNGDVIQSTGKTYDEVLFMIANEIIDPTYEAPNLTITLSVTAVQEVGTTYVATLNNVFSRGKILGKIVGTTWDPLALQNFRSGPSTSYVINGITQSGASLNVSRVLVFGSNVFTSVVNYSIGDQPKNNAGQNFETPLPAGSISKSLTITARRKQFYGNTTSVINTSSLVRSLPLNNFDTVNSFTISLSTTKYVISIPSNKNLVNVVTSNNESLLANFGTPVVFNVNDAGTGFYSYKIYTFQSALPLALNAVVTLS